MNVVKELVAAANELVAADKMQASDWLTVDQVRGICPACADGMVKKGISRVRASVFQAKMKRASLKQVKVPKEFLYGRSDIESVVIGVEDTHIQVDVLTDGGQSSTVRYPNDWRQGWHNGVKRTINLSTSQDKGFDAWVLKVFGISKDIVASSKTSADVLLQAVAKAIQGKSFMTLRAPLTALGIGRVDMYDSGDVMHWRINTKNGKKIVVVSSRGAEADQDDIVVGDLLVGYAPEGRRF